MAHKTEQIRRFYGDYGDFTLELRREGDRSLRFVTRPGESFTAAVSWKSGSGSVCRFYFGNDSGITVNGEELPLVTENGISRAKAVIKTDSTGLFFFHFELERDGKLKYLSPAGMTESFTGEWQLLSCDEKYPSDHGFTGGIIYHVFVDRFARGGDVPVRDDAVINPDWYGGIPEYAEKPGEFLKNNTFFGGTLYGVASKLDYIASLGTDCLYLSPIFEAYSNHKYDTGDYLKIDAMFGGEKALKELIAGCKKRGIRLMLDGVFNHVGDDSVYFDRFGKYGGGAYSDPNSPYRDWFTVSADGGYECWWGVSNLPKVRKNSGFSDFICGTVIPEYMKLGVGGWRLDVVDEYPEAFLERITASAKKCDRDAYMLGEVWEDASDKIAYGERKSYFCGAALDGVMNYPFRSAVIDFIMTGDTELIVSAVTQLVSHYPHDKLCMCMNMLGTHDTERIMTVLGGEAAGDHTNAELAHMKMTLEQYAAAKKRFIAAYTLLAALPGKTAVYYGDEAGMEGYRDPFNRRPFPWGREDGEITSAVRNVNKAKRASDPLVKGETLLCDAPHGVFAFVRECGGDAVTCVSNMSGKSFALPRQSASIVDNKSVSAVDDCRTLILKGDIFK